MRWEVEAGETTLMMYVRAFSFPTAESAYQAWLAGEERLENVSLWRTTTPDRSGHYVVICGRGDDDVDWTVFDGGIERPIGERDATPFLMRRLKVILAEIEAGTTGHVRHVMHYEDQPGGGVRFAPDGGVSDA